MTIYLGDTCEQISVYSECDGYLYHPNVFGLYNNTKVDANGYSVFEQVDKIKVLGMFFSEGLSILANINNTISKVNFILSASDQDGETSIRKESK